MIPNKIFGTDGIRDIANSGCLTPEFVVKLGKIIGSNIIKPYLKKRVIIGRDTRPSGKTIENALSTGLIATGVDIVKTGVISTPGLAYLTKCNGYSLGIMISASHNPADYNGIKLFSSNGLKITSLVEEEIERHISAKSRIKISSPLGSVLEVSQKDLIEKYIDDMLEIVIGSEISKWGQGIKVVIDCANGSLFAIARTLFRKTGAMVISIHSTGKGENINRQCGSLYPEVLRRKVLATKSHIGFSFDGDGDRVIVVDEKGNIRDGDHVLYVASLYLKKRRLLKHNTVVGTIMTNSALENVLANQGIKLHRTAVGDKYVLEKMMQGGFSIGGEPSGHIIFSDYSKNGDGIITALMMLKIMKEERNPLSVLSGAFVKYPQIIVNVPVKSKPPLEKIKPIQQKTEEIKKVLNNQGRIILRYSGTESLARIMIEGDNLRQIESLADDLAYVIKQILGK